MGATGLQTHIWNNEFKALLLLLGFPMLLVVLFYALALGVAGFIEAADPFVWAADVVTRAWPLAVFAAAAWFVIAYLTHQAILDAAVGARPVSRNGAPRVYNLLENLCISRGMTPPDLRIIETPALNAYASGLHHGQYAITVTRGLVDALDDAELEAVLAHELSHIRNHDVRLLVVAVIFVGVFSFFGEQVFRALTHGDWRHGARGPTQADRGRDDGAGGGRGGGAAVAIIAALALMALAYALAVVIRFSLSRNREYLADAGAVELTKNPDALISALRKVAGQAAIPGAPAEMREMFFENAAASVADFLATHPPIERRIAALQRYAGGRDLGADGAPIHGGGPWGGWGAAPRARRDG